MLALAEALKREKPERTAAQARRILQLSAGWAPSDRTLQRLFERLELNVLPREEEEQRALGRFECTRPNEMWTGDTLHGPVIAGGKSYLFAFLDDHSRAVMGARRAYHDDVVRMAAAFRPALQRRGVPRAIYLDNGSPFVDAWLLRGPRHQAHPLTAREAGGKREDRAVFVRHEARGRIPGLAGRNSEGGSWV